MRGIIAGFAGVVVLASSASAQQEFELVTSGDFNVSTNWDPQGVPNADDRIKIPAGKTCTVTANATIDTMEVLGRLDIEPGITLTLENDDHIAHQCPPLSPSCTISDNSIVDGTVELLDDEGTGSTLKFVNETHVVAGDGSIEASDTTASKIQIAGDIALKNQLDTVGNGIVGAMTIEGLTGSSSDGVIFNQGRIEARGVLVVDAELDDIDDALWLAGCKSSLGFERGSTDLDGDFSNDIDDDGVGEPGEFEFLADVLTCGAYVRSCGWITVDESSGVTFEYADFVDLSLGSCPNPATSGSGTCQDPYVVVENVSGASCQ